MADVQEPKISTEWASEHSAEALGEPLLLPTDRDESLARIRVAVWRRDRPDFATRLLRRTVTTTYGEWEEVEA